MVNNGDIQQTMAFKFSVTEGKTESTSHKIAFSYGVKVRFEAGVFGSAESKYEISFTFSHDHTFSSSISTGHGNTKTYEFPLSVPAHSTYVGKGMVHEAEMDVPYELVFDFGGTKRSVKGIWKGVAVSKATFGVQMNDVADELKSYAEKASSCCSKVRFGRKGEADAAKIEADQHYDNFKDKSKGLLTDKSYTNIKLMLWRAAWYAANTRIGYDDDAENDLKSVKEHYYNLINEGEVSETLAKNVRKMGSSAAWFAANTIVGYKDDAVRDKANLDASFNKIGGQINLVAMNFFMDDAKILAEKPKLIHEENLVNNSDVQQTMAFKFSVTEGKTESTSHKIAFSYGIKVEFEAGFFDFAKSKYETSFTFSHDHTFSSSISTGTTKTYEFPLSVPAHSTYVGKGMVHEAEMDVPYELVFDFGGTKRSVKGIWKGVAVSKATYQVDKKQEDVIVGYSRLKIHGL
ncbi:hypothetical protein OS493_032025 [Desmophyllum pertusum]|uniref:Uncharacterized protein n=1 Tax=Desmophyllum pertusum TaxID=174260 RepID=A0A9W9YW55_9CNID|nr:hypothetical protein OS493_032025 [Desmophyllum pertusum]